MENSPVESREWKSEFLTKELFDQVRDNPVELLQLVELFAKDRIEAEKQTDRIESLEKQIQILEQSHCKLAETHSKVSADYSFVQSKITEKERALSQKTVEIEELNKKLNRLEDKCNQQTGLITNLRNEKEQQEFTDKAKIAELELSYQQLTILHNNAKIRLEKETEKTEQLSEKLTYQEDELVRLRAAYTKETERSKELIEYKSTAEKRISHLDNTNKSIQVEKEELVKQYENRLGETTKELEMVKRELEKYPAQLLSLSSLEGENKSKVLQQLIESYEGKAKELQEEKLRNTRLTAILENIQQALAEKTPIIEQQRREYFKAQAEKENLTKMVEKALIEADDYKKLSRSLQKETSLLKTEREDLIRQVQLLLEENRRIVEILPEKSKISLISKSSPIAGNYFRNIVELSEKNLQLRRALEEQRITFEEEIQGKYKNAIEELKVLRHNQPMLKAKIAKLEKLAHSPSQPLAIEATVTKQTPSVSSQTPNDELLKEHKELQDALHQSKEALEATNREKSRLQVLIEGLREQKQEYEIYVKELQKNFDDCREELTKRNIAYHQLQQQTSELSTTLTAVKTKCNEHSRKLDEYKHKENSWIEKSSSLNAQLSMVQQEKSTIEACLKRFEILTTHEQESRAQQEELYKKELFLKNEELKNTKEQNSKLFERYRETIKDLDLQAEKADIELKKQKQIAHEQVLAKESIAQSLSQTQVKLEETRQQLKESESRLNLLIKQGFGASDYSTQGVTSNSDLRSSDSQSKIESLEEQLSHAIESQERYKAMLEQADATAIDIEKKSEEQMQECLATIGQLELKYKNLAKEKQLIENEIQQLKQILQNTQEASSRQGQDSTYLQDEIQTLKDQCKILGTEKEEYKMKQKQLEMKYEQEMRIHKEDVETLQSVKVKLQEEKTSNHNLLVQLKEQENNLKQLQESLSRKLNEQKEKYEEIQQRNEDLQEQNSLLQSQLERASFEISDDEEGGNSGTTKSTAELQQVIRNLQEKNHSLETELTVIKNRLTDVQTRSERLQAEVDQYQAQAKQQRSQQPVVTSIIDKDTQSQNILRESNTLLRKKVRELEAKMNQLKPEVEALRKENQNLQNVNTTVEVLRKHNEELIVKCKEWEDVVHNKMQQHNSAQELQNALQESLQRYQDLENTVAKCNEQLQEQKNQYDALKKKFDSIASNFEVEESTPAIGEDMDYRSPEQVYSDEIATQEYDAGGDGDEEGEGDDVHSDTVEPDQTPDEVESGDESSDGTPTPPTTPLLGPTPASSQQQSFKPIKPPSGDSTKQKKRPRAGAVAPTPKKRKLQD